MMRLIPHYLIQFFVLILMQFLNILLGDPFTLHFSSPQLKMNTAGRSQTLDSSDNRPISQHSAENRSSSSFSSNGNREGQKRTISLTPIWKHLGFAMGKKSTSSNGSKLEGSTQQGTSDKDKVCRSNPSVASSALSSEHNAEPPLHSVSGSQTENFVKDSFRNKEKSFGDRYKPFRHHKSPKRSALGPDYCAESPSTSVSYVSRGKIKKSTSDKSQYQTEETFEETIKSITEGEEQCSPVIIATNALFEGKGNTPEYIMADVDEFSESYSFGKRNPVQAKGSKLKHARYKQEATSGRTECYKIHKEATDSTGEVPLQSLKIENNFSQECDILGHMEGYIDLQNVDSLPTSFGKKKVPHITRSKPGPACPKDGYASRKQKPSHQKPPPLFPFDICESECGFHTSREVIFAKDEEQGSEMCQLGDGDHSRVLRSGMVLLKGYLTQDEQVSVVRECRNLGLGEGGFYQPGYDYGAKLRLMMMCLGRDWDPQTRKYSNQRRLDNSQPPNIPHQFLDMVSRAMMVSQALTETEYEHSDVATVLPMMLPNICIVNFYSTTGRLGLHQDRDESRESLDKGLPVVSISVGDSAEFLYGDERDIRKAEKLVLESGDVLIFGGESRHIFHGVESISPGSAPEYLLEETRLRPGRLNLTFRQF